MTARVVAVALGARFVYAEDVIFFDEKRQLNDASYKAVADALKGAGRAVLSGFYGRGADGKVRTFSRGGSDITGG